MRCSNYRNDLPYEERERLRQTAARIDGLLFESPAVTGKADLAVIETALPVLGSSLTVADPQNNLHDRLP